MSVNIFQLLLIAAIFLFAGSVKGVVGMGLPMIAIGVLGLFIVPAHAAALLVVPSLLTNSWQYLSGPHRMRLLHRLWPMLLAIAVVTCFSSGLIAGGHHAVVTTALGAALIVYGVIGLSNIRLSIPKRAEPWLSPIVGALTGVVTGATGVLVIPSGPYLQAIGLEKDDLVQALGLSFTVSTVALAAGLAGHGAFHATEAGLSTLCTIPAIAGVFIGQRIRTKVDPATFRRLFLTGLLLVGCGLILRANL